MDGEFLGIALCPILEHADGHRLAQLDGRGRVAAPVDAGVDSVGKGDVVRNLVQLAVDRERTRTGVGQQRKPITGWDYWIWDGKIAVEEEFQDGNASARDGAMAGRIRRMGRRAFGESLGEEVVPVSVEAGLHRLGVEHVVVHVALERVAEAFQNLADNRCRLTRDGAGDESAIFDTIPYSAQGEQLS